MAIPAAISEEYRQLIAELDDDNDGFISANMLAPVLQITEDQLRMLVGDVDALLSTDEFYRYLATPHSALFPDLSTSQSTTQLRPRAGSVSDGMSVMDSIKEADYIVASVRMSQFKIPSLIGIVKYL